MLSTLGLVLIGLSVLGILAMAAKFGLGPVPADYHAESLARGGTDPVPLAVVMVRGAVYRALAGLLIAVALGLAALALALALALRAGGGAMVFVAMAGMVLAAGGATALVTLRVERETGVRRGCLKHCVSERAQRDRFRAYWRRCQCSAPPA